MQPLPREVRELLCVRLDTMGDVLMTGPALRALRGAAPDRRVTLLTSEPGAGVAALMPEVDDTIVYEAPWLKRERTSDPDGDRQMIAALRERAFDAAVIFTVYTQSPLPAALLCHLAGVPLRGAHCRENPYGLLSHWVAEREPNHTVRHEVRRQLDLAAALGARARDERLAVALPESARARAADALRKAGVDRGAPWAVVHPGATAASRRYPDDLWALACRALADEHGLRLVFTGDSAEVAVAERVRRLAGDPGPSLAGRLSLAELAALLEAAPLLLAGNTGPVHLAAAVRTPVVDVYALTNPQHAPWMVPSRVLYQDVPCRWCYSSVCREGHHRCLLDVTPEQIVTAALDLLAGRPQPEVVLPPVPAGWEARPPRDIGKEAAWRG
jgi:lipopolysaccharide heptosyltransferase II